MKLFIAIACLLCGLSLSACSSLSLPSVPWFGSSADSNPTAEALFDEAMNYFQRKSYATAIDRFQRFKAEYPFSPRLTEAELKIADAYYLDEQYPEAVAAFKEFQALHPTNEQIPFVVYRLGQAHFDQFTSIDRDQKTTEIAKGYFENLITAYPQSPYAPEAREKLAKCIEYLAEHEFNVAAFYLKQEKYPAARDRLEEIVRRYRGTPTSVKSLYHLGEAYRHEKNGIKAALAYEAVIQHHPESRFAQEAKLRLAEVVKEKHDPLALLLMRDRRPGSSPAPETPQEPALDKLKDLKLIAKTDVVHEEPGSEKGIFRRVADRLNPFSSGGGAKTEDEKAQPVKAAAAPKSASPNEESKGFFASMWSGLNPFSAQDDAKPASAGAKNSGLVSQIDESLRAKGVEAPAQKVASNPPQAELPAAEDRPAAPAVDTTELVGRIDANLKEEGKSVAALPPAPEAAPVLNTPLSDVEAAQAAARAEPRATPISDSGLLSSIDRKLKTQGIEPPKAELPAPPGESTGSPAGKDSARQVELEPKLPEEKGPLFLESREIPAEPSAEPGRESTEPAEPAETAAQETPAIKELPASVVQGSAETKPAIQAAAKKVAEQKDPSVAGEEDPKGVFDQIREDVGRIQKALNPFQW